MKAKLFYPESVMVADAACKAVGAGDLGQLSTPDFMRVWCSVVYLNPGLHSDHYLDPDYECAPFVRAVLAEVWRRADAGELTEDELYPAEVIHARLCAA